MSSLTQGIINQKIQDTVDDKNNSWLQSYERNIFCVCVLDEQVALKQQQQCSAPGRLQVQQIFHLF